jgi:hypothetical protein
MNNLGFAVFNNRMGGDRSIDSDAWRFGLIHPVAGSSLPYRWEDAFWQLRSRLRPWLPTHLIIEWPSFFHSTKGKIAATQGHTLNLAGMAAYLAGRFYLAPNAIMLVTPQTWKGMVPKRVTQMKFIRHFGPQAAFVVRHNTDDVIDAIMLADYWLRQYEKPTH